MRKTIEKIYCDICHCENTHNDINSQKLSVIFVTEQTEGYSCNPYLSTEIYALAVLIRFWMGIWFLQRVHKDVINIILRG